MNLQEIKQLVSRGEGQTIEFKRKANYPEKIVKEVVAFANSQGGHLLIGVDDDGTIAGLRHVEDEAFVLKQAFERYCRPAIQYTQTLIPLTEKKALIHYQIAEGQRKPHYVKHEEEKRSYVRVADRSIQASREMREILRRRQNPKDIGFIYGEKEGQLMAYLRDHSHITINEFKGLAKLNKYISSRTLVRLVLANVLDIMPREGEDWYVLKERQG